MRYRASDPGLRKTWSYAPYSPDPPFEIGYMKHGIDDPRRHTQNRAASHAAAAHAFRHSSPDDLRFIGHAPGLASEDAHQDKTAAARERLA